MELEGTKDVGNHQKYPLEFVSDLCYHADCIVSAYYFR